MPTRSIRGGNKPKAPTRSTRSIRTRKTDNVVRNTSASSTSSSHIISASVDRIETGVASLHINDDVGPRVNQSLLYSRALTFDRRMFQLSSRSTFAFADWDEKRFMLNGSYVLLQTLQFEGDGRLCVLYTCSCDVAAPQRERLLKTDSYLEEDINLFQTREEGLFCVHAACAKNFPLHYQEPEDIGNDNTVEQLSSDPFLVAAHDGYSYGLLKRVGLTHRLFCVQCTSQRRTCSHVAAYRDWCLARGEEPDIVVGLATERPEPNFKSISSSPIPYPWTDDMNAKYKRYQRQQEQFPRHLVPAWNRLPCRHGNQYSNSDPIQEGWVTTRGCVIFTDTATITSFKDEEGVEHERTSYYRPTTGTCSCKLRYDGVHDLLHNLDDKNMFYFGMLLQYLHDMVEGRRPLKTAERSFNRTRRMVGEDLLSYTHLRSAWNAWARRLEISWTEVFKCKECGPCPDVVVMDGTAIGFRKDMLPHGEDNTLNGPQRPPVLGSTHRDRTYVRSTLARDLLLKYSTNSRGKKEGPPMGISNEERECLIEELEQCDQPELGALVNQLGGRKCPSEYKELMSELARNHPVCGVLQIGDCHEQVFNLITDVLSGKVYLRSSRSRDELSFLQRRAPVLADLLCKIGVKGKAVTGPIKQVILELFNIIDRTFDVPQPSPVSYPESSTNIYTFFPNIPAHRGRPRYTADREQSTIGLCRKESYGHPTLTPGIFTMFCKHGVALGFQVMKQCESPRHPFDILAHHFPKAPKVVIYDNACRLHAYALNREPYQFRDTRFLVDRFHFKGHKSCPLGYCMDRHGADLDINSINSQVNEQANAGLIRIQPQLSYMSPANFIFHTKLFLALKNIDKNSCV